MKSIILDADDKALYPTLLIQDCWCTTELKNNKKKEVAIYGGVNKKMAEDYLCTFGQLGYKHILNEDKALQLVCDEILVSM